MKSGKRIVLKAAEGITSRVQEDEERIVIEAINEQLRSDYSGNYNIPKIPEGYVHLKGTWHDGFVIQNQADGSIFTWIPVGYLYDTGTLDGKNFVEKFGRRNFYNHCFSETGYHEEVNQEFIESVKKHGGCYISSCHASEENGKLVFKKGNMPWVNINYYGAEKAAASYAKDSKDVVSIITNGAVFDSMLSWIVKAEAKTLDEVVKDSTSWGNYRNSPKSPQEVMPTGSDEKWCACNIYDIAGNVVEWTSEEYGYSCRVQRGGYYYYYDGDEWPAAGRGYYNPFTGNPFASFRAVLYLK